MDECNDENEGGESEEEREGQARSEQLGVCVQHFRSLPFRCFSCNQ